MVASKTAWLELEEKTVLAELRMKSSDTYETNKGPVKAYLISYCAIFKLCGLVFHHHITKLL